MKDLIFSVLLFPLRLICVVIMVWESLRFLDADDKNDGEEDIEQSRDS